MTPYDNKPKKTKVGTQTLNREKPIPELYLHGMLKHVSKCPQTQETSKKQCSKTMKLKFSNTCQKHDT